MNIDLKNTILEIFTSILADAEKKGEKYHTKVTRQNPDGGYTDCRFDMYNIKLEDFSDLTNQKLKSFFDHPKCIEKKAVLDDFEKRMTNSVLHELRESVIIACIHGGGHHNVISTLDLKAVEISRWIQREDDQIKVRMRILTELPRRNIPGWSYDNLTCLERTLMAHRSGISSDDFLSRLSHSSTFSRLLENDESKAELTNRVDKFLTILSMTLWRPIHLDDLWIEDGSWRNCPFIPFSYMSMYGAYKYSCRDASSIDFHSTCFGNGFSHQLEVDSIVFSKAQGLIDNKPEMLYPLKRIFKGVHEVLSSSNEPEFVSESQALDGLHDILIGMDGLIGESPKGVGHRKFYEQMWRKILDGLSFSKHPNANSNKNIISRAYDLRCELAHGTNRTVHQKIERFKRSLGDNYNPNCYDSKSLGFSMNQFLKEVFAAIINDPKFTQNLEEYRDGLIGNARGLPEFFEQFVNFCRRFKR